MATVVDDKVKEIVDSHGWLKVILSVLFPGLTFGKMRGWFSKSSVLFLALSVSACGFSMRTVGQHDAIVDTVRAVSSDNRAAIEAQSKAQAETVKALAEALVAASAKQDNGAGAIQAMASALATSRASEGLREAAVQSCPLPVTVNVPPIVVKHVDSAPKDCAQNFTLSCAEKAVAK